MWRLVWWGGRGFGNGRLFLLELLTTLTFWRLRSGNEASKRFKLFKANTFLCVRVCLRRLNIHLTLKSAKTERFSLLKELLEAECAAECRFCTWTGLRGEVTGIYSD